MITLLNDPPISCKNFPLQIASRLFRELKHISVRNLGHTVHRKYRGHSAVTRSIFTGLMSHNYPVVLNPPWQLRVTNIVWVLSGVETLKYALNLKKQGVVDKVIAGPNIVIFSDDHDSIIGHPLVDLCVVPSKLVQKHYLEYCPSLVSRCAIWPAGVDINFWKPAPQQGENVLFYIKDMSAVRDVEQLQTKLIECGIGYSALYYGGYTKEEFLKALRSSACMIVYSGGESQGLALAEAWSVNVPTFVRAVDADTVLGRRFESSSAPFLSESTGQFFTKVSEASKLIFDRINKNVAYYPRKWVVDNMSDSISASVALSLLKSHGIIDAH